MWTGQSQERTSGSDLGFMDLGRLRDGIVALADPEVVEAFGGIQETEADWARLTAEWRRLTGGAFDEERMN